MHEHISQPQFCYKYLRTRMMVCTSLCMRTSRFCGHTEAFRHLRRRTLHSRSLGFSQQKRHQSISVKSSTFSSSHEYIVVGAGSAGCVVSSRLSAEPGNRVLLLEAGPEDSGWRIRMPAAVAHNLEDDKYNWRYMTEPQKYLNNRCIEWPRGRVLGGSSSINAMIYCRGHALDYDRWEAEGAQGWSYSDCLPYFKKSQSHELGPDDYRGGDGPLHVSRGKSQNPLHQAFIHAGLEAGYPFTDDVNGCQQEGFGWMDMTIHKGKRWSLASAYLRRAQHRSNFTVETRAFTHRIIFDKNRAIGVEYEKSGTVVRAEATKEVILCGGAVNSPQILMLSGVGDANRLKELGINLVAHVPGVGRNLQDHVQVYLQYECKQPITLRSTLKLHNKIIAGLQWFLLTSGPCSSTHIETGAFIKTSPQARHPDVMFQFLPIFLGEVEGAGKIEHGYQLCVSIMRPTSRGYLKLKSRDPREHPIIQPHYLSTEHDRRLLRDAVKAGREVMQQKALDPFRSRGLRPGDDLQSDEDLDAYIRNYSKTDYHPSCTCKMGSEDDPTAVVNNETRVVGVENLRVVDASVMPSIVSGNLNGPTVMIAEKATDIILGNTS